jgi:hypothetical protein
LPVQKLARNFEARERWPFLCIALPKTSGAKGMKAAYWAFLASLGALTFLVFFIADREREAGVERLSNYKIPPPAALESDPGSKPVTTKRPVPER